MEQKESASAKKLRVRLYGGFSLALLLVLLGGFLSYRTIRNQTSEAQWVEHTYKVLNQAERLQRLVYEMGTSRRGFRSTGDEKFLAAYNLTIPKITPALNDLKTITEDNSSQAQIINQLEIGINDILIFWQRLGSEISDDNLKVRVKVTEEEAVKMEKIRGFIQEIIQYERKLLTDRKQKTEATNRLAQNIIIINTIFILLVALILVYITLKELKQRLRSQQTVREKLEEVVVLNDAATEKNWLLTGMSAVNDSLQGNADISSLAQKSLRSVVKYLEVPGGALYFYDGEKKVLELSSGVALPADARQQYALNEGVIGFAATQEHIHIVKDVPAGYWKLSSSSGMATPDTIICVPLRVEEELEGVLELATFKEIIPRQLRLLESVASDIAIALQSANSRKKVMTLLEEVQVQKEILESQQEELRQSNEELTRQSEILQASEEELRVQEEELRQINLEMNENNAALELARQELSRKAQELEQTSTYKSEFLANMSHELRTPLNSVLILAKLLEENKHENLTPKQTEYAGIIHKSGADLLRLINDILDLSKIEAGKVDFHFEKIKILDILSNMHQLFNVVADEKKLNFVTEIIEGTNEFINSDRPRLEQVLRNLLSNAFKFTPEGGTVKLVVNNRDNNNISFTVTDTGVGIPKDKQQLIFEAFRQADGSTSRKYGGTGLGLSISREIVFRLGGVMQVTSIEKKGSSFMFFLPIDGEEAAISTVTLDSFGEESEDSLESEATYPTVNFDTPATQTQVEDDRDALTKNDKPLLIIEDDANFAGIVRDFARNKGYKTVVALNGDEGLFYARKYKPAAIILDMGLPVIDGNSILKILKNNDELKNILVHVISANEVSGGVRKAIEGYSQKPLRSSDLELVFTGITSKLRANFKKVLVISADEKPNEKILQSISEARQIPTEFIRVQDVPQASLALNTSKYDGIVLDCNSYTTQELDQLRELREIAGSINVPVIVCLDHDISGADELQLKKYADVIIRKSVYAQDRVIDELELFLFKVKEIHNTPRIVESSLPESVLKGKKILLADDDMRNVFSLTALLSEQGMEVISAGDGKEALDLLNMNPDVNLVLMDIMMPGMDGYEAMKHIRRETKYQRLPVIALTAKAMPGDREKCITAGASDYIAKPVDNSKLLSLMRVWLS